MKERMTDEQIQWCIDYCRRLSAGTPILKTGMEYASVAQTITQLRTDLAATREKLRVADAKAATLRLAAEKLIGVEALAQLEATLDRDTLAQIKEEIND